LTPVARASDEVLYVGPTGPSTAGADMLTLDKLGTISRYREGRGLTAIGRLAPVVDGGPPLTGGFAELTPGEVLVAWSSDPKTVWLRRGEVLDTMRTSSMKPLTAVASDPSVGGFAMSGPFGELLEWSAGRWVESQPATRLEAVGFSLRVWRGLLFGVGSEGAIRQHVPGVGFCPRLHGGGNAIRGLVLGDRLVGAAGHGDDNQLLIIEQD